MPHPWHRYEISNRGEEKIREKYNKYQPTLWSCSSPVIGSKHKITSRNNAQFFPDAIFARISYIKKGMASCLLDCKKNLTNFRVMADAGKQRLQQGTGHYTPRQEDERRELWETVHTRHFDFVIIHTFVGCYIFPFYVYLNVQKPIFYSVRMGEKKKKENR